MMRRLRFTVASFAALQLLVVAAMLYVFLFSTTRNSDSVDVRLPGRTVRVLKVLVPLPLMAASLALYLVHCRQQRVARDRHEAGLCVTCGYDLRGNPTAAACPECGAPAGPR
jgi:hypothetical protein